MKKIRSVLATITALALIVVQSGHVYAATQTIDFNNLSDLTNNFTGDSDPQITNVANGGINNSGSVDVPSGTDDVWTSKASYSVTGVGDEYRFSGLFYIVANGGYGGFGITAGAQNEPYLMGNPSTGIGVAFHGGGAELVSDGLSPSSFDWYATSGDLLMSNWYSVEFEITRTSATTFDVELKIYESDSTGAIGALFTQQEEIGVTNTSLASTTQVYPFFSTDGSRVGTADNIVISTSTSIAIRPVVDNTSTVTPSENTAEVSGEATGDQGLTITDRGFCYGTSPNPSTTGTCVSSGSSGVGQFTQTLTGLLPGTTYYLQSYATSSGGTGYSTESTFTTLGTAGTTTPAATTTLANTGSSQTSMLIIATLALISVGLLTSIRLYKKSPLA